MSSSSKRQKLTTPPSSSNSSCLRQERDYGNDDEGIKGQGQRQPEIAEIDINWRNESVRNRLGYILENDSELKDITFLVGSDEVPVSAHKFILKTSSSYFETLISTHEQLGRNEIKLPYVTVSMFKRLLKFVYTDELQFTDLGIFLSVAQNFGFFQLPWQTLEILKKIKLSPANSIHFLEVAMEYSDKELEQYCLNFIHSNANRVLEAQEFVGASFSVLSRILQDDYLEADEIVVFKAVMRWARSKCKVLKLPPSSENLRDVLRATRMFVRYTLIPYDLLLADVKNSGLFSSSEFLQILKTFIDPSDNPLGLNTKPRNKRRVESPLLEPVPQPQLQISSQKNLPLPHSSKPTEKTVLVAERRMPQRVVADEISRNPVVSSTNTLHPSVEFAEIIPPLMSIQTNMNAQPVVEQSWEYPVQVESNRFVDLQQPWISHSQIPVSDYQFVRTDCVMSFHQLLVEVHTRNLLHPIEEIILQNVDFYGDDATFVDSGPVKVDENRVYLKKLKKFVFYQSKDLNCSLPDFSFMKGLTTKQFLFFETGPESSVPWTFKTLWNLGVNISIDVKGIKLLEIDHVENSLTLSFPVKHEANEIISGLSGASNIKKYPLKTACITSCQIVGDDIPTHDLQVLVLQGVDLQSPDTTQRSFSPFRIANKCCYLTRLSLFSPGGCQLSLGSDLARCRGVLQSMALSKVRIGGWTKKIMRDELIFKSLEEMYLDVCTWADSFVDYFPMAFPSLRRIAIRSVDRCRVTAKFLKMILSIKSVERVAIFRYVCDNDTHENPNLDIFTPPVKIAGDKDEMHKLLVSAGMHFVFNQTEVPDFILARDPTSSVGWKVIVDFQELDEAHFHCSLLGKFFADSDVSKSIAV